MEVGKVYKVRFIDHSDAEVTNLKLIQDMPEVILTVYGELRHETEKYLWIVSCHDNEEGFSHPWRGGDRGFTIKIFRPAILEAIPLEETVE